MRLQKFLLEKTGGAYYDRLKAPPRSKGIKDSEFLKRIRNHDKALKAYFNDGTAFYRGVKKAIDGNIGIVDPTKSRRTSSYTSNYYTVIMSESQQWKPYPKRDESIVGSSGRDKAEGYSDTGKLYLVLPHNNGKIAMTHSEDLWGAFQHVFEDDAYPLGEFNEMLDNIFAILGYSDAPDDSLNELKAACSKLDERIKEIEAEIGESLNTDTSNTYRSEFGVGAYLGRYWEQTFEQFYKGDAFKMLLEIFDPKKAGIKIIRPGQKMKRNVELWTDAESILIDLDKLEDDAEFYAFIRESIS